LRGETLPELRVYFALLLLSSGLLLSGSCVGAQSVKSSQIKTDLYEQFIQNPEPTWYHSLHQAPRFDEIAVSIDGHMSQNYFAFATAWQAKDKARLLSLVEHAQPAGKLYAAICLYNIDKLVAQDAFERLALSKESVQTGYACKISQDSVERIAKSYLHGRMPIVLPTANNLRRTVDLYYDNGQELLAIGKFKEALLELNKALALHSRSPKTLLARAKVYQKLGQGELAQSDTKLSQEATLADKQYGLGPDGEPMPSDSIFEPRLHWK